MENLRWNDIRFGRNEGERFVTIFIARSKTDQAGTGVYRSLTAGGGKVCVVKTLLRWANINDWDPDSKEKVFGSNILKILGRTLERISAVKGLPTRLYTTHCLRAGGETQLYLSGAALDITQRFGRWISPCFLAYLHYDNIALRHIGNMFKEGRGVLDQQR